MLLVTGGAGFIGSHVAAAALARGWRVRVLDDLSTGDTRRVPDGAELLEGDVADPATVRHALEGVTAVAHLAAHRAVPRSLVDPLATDRANTAGTLCVLEGARACGIGSVVIASSSSVYGAAATLPTPEATPPAPRSPYAVSKLAAELYAQVYADLHGMRTVSLRLFNVYGPGQPPDGPYAQLVPRFLGAVLSGEAPVVEGDGRQSRDLVYVDDVAAAFVAALTSRASGVVNVGTGRATSVLDVLAAVEQATGRHVRPRFAPGRPGDVRHTCADAGRAARVMGWRARVGLEEGLARTAAAMKLTLSAVGSTAPGEARAEKVPA